MKLEAQANRLEQAASSYLHSARHQPVHWYEWGGEAFNEAARQDKPILLDIGAVWCHWCHVMDRESYEQAEIAALINDLFIAIKVDRDERPDVDSRYQAAVASISGGGGWPLTAFLTPAGKPYFGGTYFPPEDRYGRPGFPRVLRSMAAAYRTQRDDVEESAESVRQAIEQNETFAERAGAPGEALLQKILESMLRQFDARHGGFGSQPKFPHPAALDLLTDAASRPGSWAEESRRVVQVTLGKMAAGGLQDQLAGGFHRYSVDERWIVPHFEKLAYDNSELLRAYTHAFQSFLDPRLARVAGSIVRWMDEWLSDREQGGFYASQDADESQDDDGDYFTWSRAEAEAELSPREFEVAAAYYNLRAVGDMHHNPAKNVLHVVTDIPALARLLQVSEEEAWDALERARVKLYAARLRRRTPFLDKTIYTGWNALCISAYLAAGRALGLPDATRFALQSLDRVLRTAWNVSTGLNRVVAYGARRTGTEPAADAIPGVLDDYVFLGHAALDGWEASGEWRYYEAAEALAKRVLDRFHDGEAGGFFDTDQCQRGAALGVLGARRKPVQDAPTPAGNSSCANLLLRLHALNGEARYRTVALETLEVFAGVVEHFGLYAAAYGLALRRAMAPPVQVCVVGEDALAEELVVAATARFLVNKSVVRLRKDHLAALPPVLAESLPLTPGVGRQTMALVCRANICLPPITDPEQLVDVLRAQA